MTGRAGRTLRISVNTGSGLAVVAGAQTENFTISAEGIDVTDKDDAGVRRFLPDVGTWSWEATVEGVLKNDDLLENMIDVTRTALLPVSIAVSGLGTLVGDVFFSSFEVSGAEGAEATTFTATLQSSGTPVYTPAP